MQVQPVGLVGRGRGSDPAAHVIRRMGWVAEVGAEKQGVGVSGEVGGGEGMAT